MTWSPQDILIVLYIAVAVMLLIALYHIIIIALDARRVTRRIERITREAESVILKPLNMTDQALNWVQAFFEEKAGKKKAGK